MPAIAIGDKIQIIGPRGIDHRFQGSTTGIADRRGRQTRNYIGVEGRIGFNILLGDRAPQTPFAPHKSVNNCRIGLQTHPLFQAIHKDTRHA